MAKAKFEGNATTASIGTIGHVDHGKTALLAAITKVLAPPPTRPDRVAVWNWDAFKRTLAAAQGVVLADPKLKQNNEFMGLRIFVDPALAPGTVELRNGTEVVRIIKLAAE